MAVSFKLLLDKFRQKDVLMRLIIINVVIFLLVNLINLFGALFELNLPDLRMYLGVSSNVGIMLSRIWTLFTYMFVQYDILHILFNMLMLYWFGQIFLTYFTRKNLVALYILGGLAGALFYILAFNTIPYFMSRGDSFMIGASASVMAIIFGAAFYNKNQEIGLLFIGRVKIVYFAWAIFIIDIIALGSGSNMGGHIAHIGGAVLGYIFAVRFRKGKDITRGVNRLFDKIVNLFKPKPKMRVTFNKRETDEEYNVRKYSESQEIDRILDKIKQSGYTSLTEQEKKRLFDASNK